MEDKDRRDGEGRWGEGRVGVKAAGRGRGGRETGRCRGEGRADGKRAGIAISESGDPVRHLPVLRYVLRVCDSALQLLPFNHQLCAQLQYFLTGSPSAALLEGWRGLEVHARGGSAGKGAPDGGLPKKSRRGRRCGPQAPPPAAASRPSAPPARLSAAANPLHAPQSLTTAPSWHLPPLLLPQVAPSGSPAPHADQPCQPPFSSLHLASHLPLPSSCPLCIIIDLLPLPPSSSPLTHLFLQGLLMAVSPRIHEHRYVVPVRRRVPALKPFRRNLNQPLTWMKRGISQQWKWQSPEDRGGRREDGAHKRAI